jgi:recombination protein RecA
MRLGEHRVEDIPAVSTTSIGIDAAIGIGGLPRGRVVEVFGPESSGKTTLALHVVAEAQRTGGIAAYIDAEHALDANYAEKLGVNINELFISQPDFWRAGARDNRVACSVRRYRCPGHRLSGGARPAG